MKRSLYLFLALTIIVAYSCKKAASLESNEISRVSSIMTGEKAVIYSAGFDTAGILFQDGHYVVEADLILTKEWINEVRRQQDIVRAGRHAAVNILLSLPHRNVSIGFSPEVRNNAMYFSRWYYATMSAARNWNSLPGSIVNFSVEPDNPNADVIVSLYQSSNFGQSGPPNADGSPYNQIQVNQTIINRNGSVRTAAQDILLMTHEMGHTMGLRHTNWNNRGETVAPYGANLIPNTPDNDLNSVMQSDNGINGLSWTGFSDFDIVAANFLYPVVSSGFAFKCAVNGFSGAAPVGNKVHNCSAPYNGENYQWRLLDIYDNLIQDFDDHTQTLEWGNHLESGNQYKLQCRLINLEMPSDWTTFIITAQ